MSRKLNLVDCMLTRSRQLQTHGLGSQATTLLQKLSNFRDLPPDVAEESQYRLAELALERREYKQARRHLAVALAYQPEEASYHYLMAVAIEDDPDSDKARAGRRYRRAITLDPENPLYLADYGAHQFQAGAVATGLELMREAAALAPDDPDIVGQLAKYLREHGALDEAQSVVRLALFRNSADRRFRNLWQEHQFEALRARQEVQATTLRLSDRCRPVILPFTRPQGSRRLGGKFLRLDGPSGLPGPKGPSHRKIGRRRKAN